MINGHSLMKGFGTIGLILTLGVSVNAEAGLFGIGGTSWKEEVLLHDGSKIMVERNVERGGRHELFKDLPIKEQRLSWSMPGTNQTVTWKDHFSQDVGSASLLPMLVDVHQGIAYVVANPMGCLAYNKWGRPNPPYVIFRYQNKEWKRIPLQELPVEIQTPNLIHSQPDVEAERVGQNPIPAEVIRKIVDSYFQAEFRTILRGAMSNWKSGCKEEIRTGDGWMSVDWFSSQKNHDACLRLCATKSVSEQNCPCNKLFERK